jgi:NAD(P)-dependent dehydrogenase (short-subunit alcohol dehydrogenase family)
MQERICLVTGASSGLGKATALGLAKQGLHVVIVCRDELKGEAAREEIIEKSGNTKVDVLFADLSKLSEVYDLAETFKQRYDHLHVLINNAGVYLKQRHVTEDDLEETMAVNYFAPFLLTNLLLEPLQASSPARVINVAGAYHRQGNIHFDNLQLSKGYTGTKANSQSQLARVLFTYELARRLSSTGVTVNCLHPGSVRTNIMRDLPKSLQWLATTLFRRFFISPERGAETILYLATSPEVENVSGKYFVNKRPVNSSKASYNTSLARQLWQQSEWLTGLYDIKPVSSEVNVLKAREAKPSMSRSSLETLVFQSNSFMPKKEADMSTQVAEKPTTQETTTPQPNPTQDKVKRTWVEEIEVTGNQLVERVKDLVQEGNTRRVIVRAEDNKEIFSVPLTAGVIVGGLITLTLPVLAALGAVAALVTKVKLEVIREEEMVAEKE